MHVSVPSKKMCGETAQGKKEDTNCRHVPRWLAILRRQSTDCADSIAAACAIDRLRNWSIARFQSTVSIPTIAQSTDTCASN